MFFFLESGHLSLLRDIHGTVCTYTTITGVSYRAEEKLSMLWHNEIEKREVRRIVRIACSGASKCGPGDSALKPCTFFIVTCLVFFYLCLHSKFGATSNLEV